MLYPNIIPKGIFGGLVNIISDEGVVYCVSLYTIH